uniref:Tyrosine aminotransferase n=1 Tax=Globodera rostochiensis TaxID=31243 RepID=A0A914HW76_GLORO
MAQHSPRRQQRALPKASALENCCYSAMAAPIKTPKKAKMHLNAPKRHQINEHSEWTTMRSSKHSRDTVNPIRRVTDSLSVAPNPDKKPIQLNLGDPTLTGCLPPSESVVAALRDAIDSHRFDGYGPAVGMQTAREAVAEFFSSREAPISADDVVLASGCSHALEMAIVAIADPGQNVLVPCPGFPLYSTLCQPNGIKTRQYRLKMEEDGLIDLQHLESLIDDQTRAIIVNNPSNPTGVVFPQEHLEQILRLAQKYKLPIVADEIYGDLTYAEGAKFHALASLSPRVPIITCDGIGKRYLVPGWRLGWLIVHNRFGVLSDVKAGIVSLSQKIVGPCALIQGALPRILRDTPQSFFDNIKNLLSQNAQIVYDILARVPGLKPLRPQGAMYMMVGFDPELYGDETSFVQSLISEESVYCLPGSAFSLPNWFRLVLAFPEETTREACERISAFCTRRLRPCRKQLALWGSVPDEEDGGGSEGAERTAESTSDEDET